MANYFYFSFAGLQDILSGSSGGGGGVDRLTDSLHSSPLTLSQVLASSRGAEDPCGDTDALTNLLVYQYLAGGGLPPSEGGNQGRSTSSAAALQALLGDRKEVSKMEDVRLYCRNVERYFFRGC